MEPPRVEELGPDGAPSSSVPFDEASWVDPLSSEWVYVDADTLPSCEPSILEPVVEVAKAAFGKLKQHGGTAILYGWVPFVLYSGMQTEPRPEAGWLALVSLS